MMTRKCSTMGINTTYFYMILCKARTTQRQWGYAIVIKITWSCMNLKLL